MMAAYLWLAIEDDLNVFVSGETASGKTTLLNALTTFIKPDAKVVTIEDTPELQVPQENWLREVVKHMRLGRSGRLGGHVRPAPRRPAAAPRPHHHR